MMERQRRQRLPRFFQAASFLSQRCRSLQNKSFTAPSTMRPTPVAQSFGRDQRSSLPQDLSSAFRPALSFSPYPFPQHFSREGHWLLPVVCDGMVAGSGNDHPTPGIVLDILGHISERGPEPLSFVSLGAGAKQHAVAKVYSGLCDVDGRAAPCVAVAKCGECGKPSESSSRKSRQARCQDDPRVFLEQGQQCREHTPFFSG